MRRLLLHQRALAMSVGLLGVGALIWWLPTSFHHVINRGTDTYAAHHALFGDRTQAQTVPLRHAIRGVGALLVNLRRAAAVSPVQVSVYTAEGALLTRTTVAGEQLRDDTFAWAHFAEAIPPDIGTVRLVFAAPDATSANPVGLRFEEQSGHLAVGVIERITPWQQVVYWRERQPNEAAALGVAVLGGVGYVGASGVLSLAAKKHQRAAWVGALVTLGVVAVAVRVPVLLRVEGVYGGDAYNYLFKSMAWAGGEDPFAADPRKAPLFSLLLLPGLLTPDPVLWGRLVSVAAATIAAVLTALVMDRLRLPRSLALGAGLLLAVSRDFRWESVHGLANTLYAMLIVAAVFSLLAGTKARGAYLVGVFCGLATLTRYEGGLVSAILLPSVWLYHYLRPRWIIYTLLPAALLTLFPLILWPLTGNIGVRTASDITSDTGLSVAYSLDDFWSNLKGFRLFIGRAWLLTPGVGDQWGSFGWGIVAGFAVVGLRRFFSATLTQGLRVMPWVLGSTVLLLLAHGGAGALEDVTLLLTGLTGCGIVLLLFRWPRYAIPLVLLCALQIFIITLLLPKPRYYLQLLPFMSVALVAAMAYLTAWSTARGSRWGALFTMGALVAVVFSNGTDALGAIAADYNSKSQATTVMLRAAKYLRVKTGVVALSIDDLSMRVMLGDRRARMFVGPRHPAPPTTAEQLAWFARERPTFVVESTANPLFTVIGEFPDLFAHQATFATAGPDRVDVYQYQERE